MITLRLEGPKPYLGDLHVHSRRSDGSLNPEELALDASMKQLDFIALTDHDTPPYKEETSSLPILPGAEFSLGHHWHMVALGDTIPMPWPRISEVPEWSDELHRTGGVLILAHPWTVVRRREAIMAIETWLIRGVLDGIELLNTGVKASQRGAWLDMLFTYHRDWARYQPAIFGGSDYHHLQHGGEIGIGCTYIFSDGPEIGQLMEAIRLHRVLATLPQPGRFGGYEWIQPLTALFPDVLGLGIGPYDLKHKLWEYRRAAETRRTTGAILALNAGNYRRALEMSDGV